MATLGVIATMAIEGVVPHFNLLVTGHGLTQELIAPVTRALPEPAQQLSLLL
jgi:hypothetical protein